MASTSKSTASTVVAKAPARTKAVVVEPSVLDTLPPAPASLGRMTLTYAKRIVVENVDGDDKLAVRVALVRPFALDHTSKQVAEKIFALYAKAGVKVPADFGDSTIALAVAVARAWQGHAIAEKITLGADLVPIFAALVRIGRAAKADGGSVDVLPDVLTRANKGRTVSAKVGSILTTEVVVGDAARARRKGVRVAATVTDTAEGRSSIESHDERAADARVGETRTARKARLASERTVTGGGNIGKGAVTPRTPESGPDPLATTPGNTTAQLPANTGASHTSGPAKVKALNEATASELIFALKRMLAGGLKVTASLDENFTSLTDAWEESARATPVSETPERELKVVKAQAAKVATVKAGAKVRASEAKPAPTGRVSVSASVTALPSLGSQMPDSAMSRAFREAHAKQVAVTVADVERHEQAIAAGA